MKVVETLTWGNAKFWLTALALAGALLLAARDRVPAEADNSEIGPSFSAIAPVWPTGSLLLVKGGHFTVGNTPCDPGISDPTTKCIRVWAKGVNNSSGASSFQVHFTYPANMLQVSAVTTETAWLGSSGRSVACNPITYSPGNIMVVCTTISAPPPFGALGDGLLVTIAFESLNVIGPALIDFSDSYLLDTPIQPAGPTVIPATVRSLNTYIGPCADLNGDGVVTVSDILYVVGHFGTTDPAADLNGDGVVTVQDILIAVGEFGFHCTR